MPYMDPLGTGLPHILQKVFNAAHSEVDHLPPFGASMPLNVRQVRLF